LGERVNGIHEVRGSIPLGSTTPFVPNWLSLHPQRPTLRVELSMPLALGAARRATNGGRGAAAPRRRGMTRGGQNTYIRK
jgi:hypothetical protein